MSHNIIYSKHINLPVVLWVQIHLEVPPYPKKLEKKTQLHEHNV